MQQVLSILNLYIGYLNVNLNIALKNPFLF